MDKIELSDDAIKQLLVENLQLKEELEKRESDIISKNESLTNLINEVIMKQSAIETKQTRFEQRRPILPGRKFGIRDIVSWVTLVTVLFGLLYGAFTYYNNLKEIPNIKKEVSEIKEDLQDIEDTTLYMRYKLRDQLDHYGMSLEQYRDSKDRLNNERK